MASSKSGKKSGVIEVFTGNKPLGWYRVTYHKETDQPILGPCENETNNIGLWVAQCHGFTVLIYNGRFITGTNNTDKDGKEMFLNIMKHMADPERRARFLEVLNSFEPKGTKYE